MKVKTKQSVGQYRTGEVIEVVSDETIEKLVKDGKEITVLSETRAKELVEIGAVEYLPDDKPKPRRKSDKTDDDKEG